MDTFLGIEGDDLSGLAKLIRQIEQGLPLSALDELQRTTQIPMSRLAQLIRIAPRTLARRREEGRLSAEESDRLVQVSRLFSAATDLFAGNIEAGVEWLTRPLRALGGAIPLDLAQTEVGRHAVERVIQQLEHGVFP
jgi:putative toxin-antitoxin system antitoxin component (TIGR02293 family)